MRRAAGSPDIASGLRQYGWYASWLRWLKAQFPEGSFWRGAYGIALALVVPLLVVGLLLGTEALGGLVIGKTGGAGGMGWSNTNEGKVIAAAFLDAHNHLVEQVRVLAAKPLPEPVRTSAKAK